MEERDEFLKRNRYDGQIVVPYRQTRNEGGNDPCRNKGLQNAGFTW